MGDQVTRRINHFLYHFFAPRPQSSSSSSSLNGSNEDSETDGFARLMFSGVTNNALIPKTRKMSAIASFLYPRSAATSHASSQKVQKLLVERLHQRLTSKLKTTSYTNQKPKKCIRNIFGAVLFLVGLAR